MQVLKFKQCLIQLNANSVICQIVLQPNLPDTKEILHVLIQYVSSGQIVLYIILD